MNRLIENIVFPGLVMACRLAIWPTKRSPLLVNATTEGVVRAPSWFAMTVGWPASNDGDRGVGGAQIDTEDFPHVLRTLFLSDLR